MILPSTAREEDDEEFIRCSLCIAEGRVRFLGERGSRGYTVVGEHSSKGSGCASGPGGAGGLLANLRRGVKTAKRPFDLLVWGAVWTWGVVSLFFKTMLEPPPTPHGD
ncbi:hypothetical protein TrRE_jg10161 [Triparma retinervis]|jgi:hypothetical protein|uniref:Transmembrane protein n=1 Tax=Triparma retinervis TaxID=2557542 RepID=A0A9W7ANN1_9STRA|nr:hypothetical protein TrRE_jg10161 [Triparma retinervis]